MLIERLSEETAPDSAKSYTLRFLRGHSSEDAIRDSFFEIGHRNLCGQRNCAKASSRLLISGLAANWKRRRKEYACVCLCVWRVCVCVYMTFAPIASRFWSLENEFSCPSRPRLKKWTFSMKKNWKPYAVPLRRSNKYILILQESISPFHDNISRQLRRSFTLQCIIFISIFFV